MGIIAQSVGKVNGLHGLMGEYLDLPYVDSLVDGEGLGAELGRFGKECLDALTVEEEGLRPDSEEQALRDIAPVNSVNGRNRLGSMMVRDEGALDRRSEAFRANEGDSPVTMEAFLRLCGWVRYRDLEAFEAWKRKVEENDLYVFMGDKGVRLHDPVSGTPYDALAAGS